MPIRLLSRLVIRSLMFRRGAVVLTVITIAVSVFTLLGTQHIQQAAKNSFSSTLSGVDLIVGPRTSDINLLLTTVFRIGHPSNNMSWASYESLLGHESVAWAIPISLGDSHKGFRVVGTQPSFFTHYQYGQSRPLTFKHGQSFIGLYEVVLGAHMAQQLNYAIGDTLVLSHGVAATSFQQHTAYPFTVVGILQPTGTPVDNAAYVSLAGLEAIHNPRQLSPQQLEPKSITAAMLGLNSKLATFKIQRFINTAMQEPLTAVLPGVALMQLWQMSRGLESTLQLMAGLMILSALLGLGAMLMATLRERRYELSVLRSLGAGTPFLFLLIQIESIGVALLGLILGSATLALVITLTEQTVATQFGIDMGLYTVTYQHGLTLLYVLLGATLVGAVPALVSLLRYRHSGF